jgi:hypothetical protein
VETHELIGDRQHGAPMRRQEESARGRCRYYLPISVRYGPSASGIQYLAAPGANSAGIPDNRCQKRMEYWASLSSFPSASKATSALGAPTCAHTIRLTPPLSEVSVPGEAIRPVLLTNHVLSPGIPRVAATVSRLHSVLCHQHTAPCLVCFPFRYRLLSLRLKGHFCMQIASAVAVLPWKPVRVRPSVSEIWHMQQT